MKNEKKLISQTARYAGITGPADPATLARITNLLEQAQDVIQFRIVEHRYRLDKTAGLRLEGTEIEIPGAMAARMLGSCEEVILIGATLGLAFDRHLERLSLFNMADAVLFDALGSAWIEEELDNWQEKKAGALAPLYLSDRFSCGYGDLPLDFARKQTALLNMERTIGVHLNDSLMMNPTKSVSAIIGLSSVPQPARIRGCAYCSLQGRCLYRQKGVTCETN